jgi:hypothetical protein
MRKLIVLFFILSCSKEYSVETNGNQYVKQLTGNGNNSYKIPIPKDLIGKSANVSFTITIYSSFVDSIGRNDYIKQLEMSRLYKKYSGNPVYKNKLVLSGKIILPDTLNYFTTTYYAGNIAPIIQDTIMVNIVSIQ